MCLYDNANIMRSQSNELSPFSAILAARLQIRQSFFGGHDKAALEITLTDEVDTRMLDLDQDLISLRMRHRYLIQLNDLRTALLMDAQGTHSIGNISHGRDSRSEALSAAMERSFRPRRQMTSVCR